LRLVGDGGGLAIWDSPSPKEKVREVRGGLSSFVDVVLKVELVVGAVRRCDFLLVPKKEGWREEKRFDFSEKVTEEVLGDFSLVG
jgi:hypothetical protein